MEIVKSSDDLNVIQIPQENLCDLKQTPEINLLEKKSPITHVQDNDSDVDFSKMENYISEIKNVLEKYSNVTPPMLHLKVSQISVELDEFKNTIVQQYKDIHNRITRFEKKDKKKLKIMDLIKRFFNPFITPKIGVLYHYNPKIMKIPSRYTKQQKIKTPLISIITPSFNQAKFIEKTMTSVLYQKYPAIEYIVQDGASTDNSIKIINKYSGLLKHWESKKDNGQAHAINLGFRRANGEIMGYLNSDDILLPGTLDYVAQYFEKHPDVDVVYGHRILIDEFDNEIGRWILPRHDNKVLSWADYIPQESLFWRRSIWNKIGGKLDESFRFAMDWDMLLRFRDAGAKFVRLPRFLGAFRIHEKQKTSAEMSKIGAEEINLLRTRCQGRLVSHYEIAANIRLYKIKHVIYHNLYKLGILRY